MKKYIGKTVEAALNVGIKNADKVNSGSVIVNTEFEYSNFDVSEKDDNETYDNTTIYKREIEMSENDIKKLPFDISFKRQLFGGELGIRTPDSFHYASFQDWCIQPLYQLSIFNCC